MQIIGGSELEAVFRNNNLGEGVVLLPTTLYVKNNGCVVVSKSGLLRDIADLMYGHYGVENFEEQFGYCIHQYELTPYPFMSIPGTNPIRKFCSFPINGYNKRVRSKDEMLQPFQRIFKMHKSVPSWMLVPSIPYIEFSAYKIGQLIKWFKLNSVLLPTSLLQCESEKKFHFIIETLAKHVPPQMLYVTDPSARKQEEDPEGTIYTLPNID